MGPLTDRVGQLIRVVSRRGGTLGRHGLVGSLKRTKEHQDDHGADGGRALGWETVSPEWVLVGSLALPTENEVGGEGGTHGGYGREDILAVPAETPNNNRTQRSDHHPNGVFCVRLVTHHTNEQQRDKDAAQPVDGEDNQGEDRIPKPWELLAAQGDEGDKHSDDHGDEFGGLVFLAPFGFDVVGDGRCTGQHLAVSGGHGSGEDGRQNHASKEGVEHFHGQQRQTILRLRGIEVKENGSAGQADDVHQCDERGLPNEEPNRCLLSVLIVLQRHDTRNDLRLARHTKAPEEKGPDP